MERSAYDRDLDRNPANFRPLTPLSFLARSAAVFPDRTAVIDGARSFTYRELYGRCRRLASALAVRGIGRAPLTSACAPSREECIEGVRATQHNRRETMIGHVCFASRTVACVAGAAAVYFSSISLAQQTVTPPPAVVVEKVEVRQIDNPVRFTARVEAIEAVDIRARVTGFLQSVAFEDGQAVKVGDILFEIEPDKLEASVESARAQVARAEATRTSAERTLARNRQLFARNTVSQAVLDEAQAAFDIAVADVQVAEAALSTAELNLSYARIAAPISGDIGRAAFTVGNLVGPDSGSLARIVSLDPIRVAFAITEGLLVTIRQEAALSNVVDPDSLKLSLRLANGTEYEQPGRIDFVESEVDPMTGAVTARAVFPNPHHILIPGQFVTLFVQEQDLPSLPVVPQSAVLRDREGRFVYLLGEDNTVAQRRIDTGARIGNGWAVTTGLDGGELVVVQGIQRLADGMTVQPNEGQPAGGGGL